METKTKIKQVVNDGMINKDVFFILTGCFQTISVLMYYLFTEYSDNVSEIKTNNTLIVEDYFSNTINHYYPFYQDVHAMIFIGFGFLMTFLYKYSYSSVSYNFLLASMCIQYAILINGFFHNLFTNHWDIIQLNIESLITGDFAAGAILISFGAVLGKASLTQLLIMVPIELIFYSINESIGVIKYMAVDMGGSMYVHTFGAYFGLSVSYILTNNEKINKQILNFKATKESNLFAMIGTIVLWIFWPSFNGALALGNAQHRVVINTVLALTNSCVFAFITSKLLRGKFEMEDIQNASLAGGVAIGSSADLVIGPPFALIIGGFAGIISVSGYKILTPFLYNRFGLHDTCGVHNLHGLPGILGGISGTISAITANENLYGDSITLIFSARETRNSYEQGGYQALALITTLFISIFGGLFTGHLMKLFKSSDNYAKDTDWEEEKEEFIINNENV